MEGLHAFCLLQLGILYVVNTVVAADAVPGGPFTVNWVTPPPQVVVIGTLYRVGCRIDLNNTVAREYKSLRLDDIKLWSVIRKVMSSKEVLPLCEMLIKCRYILLNILIFVFF